MRREPDQHLRAYEFAHLGDGLVVLAHVHAVRPAFDRQVGPVVQPEEGTVLVADGPEAGRRAEYRVVAGVLVAQLDHVDPAAQGRGEHMLRRGLDD